MNPIYFIVFSQKTAFFKLSDIYGECALYQKDSPLLEPVVCLQFENSCHVGRNCIEKLVKRIHILFNEIVPYTRLIILYFRKRNIPGLGGAIFFRNMKEPRIITMNPYAWKKIKERGLLYKFYPSSEFFLSGQAFNIIESNDTNVL